MQFTQWQGGRWVRIQTSGSKPVVWFSRFTFSAEPKARIQPRVVAFLLILLAASLRLTYLAYDCPLDLSPDEGHYWDWSRHLDWSYYSKGPLVAYMIRASCLVFGERMWAVRLPALLCSSLTLAGLYVLTSRIYQRPALALGVVVLALTQPAVAAGALLMTIDAPYVCCWTWALVIAHHAVLQSSCKGHWLLLGLLMGLGILAKYTMVLFLPSFVLFLLTLPNGRKKILSLDFGLMLAMAGCCSLPIAIWNAQHGWVTLLHVGRQAGMFGSRGSEVSLLSTLQWQSLFEYIGGQAGLLLVFWFLAWAYVMIRWFPYQSSQHVNLHQRFLWWMSAPMFVLFLCFSLKTRIELNWPVAAYLSGMVLVAGWISAHWAKSRLLPLAVYGFAALGLVVTIVLHHSEWLYPLHDAVGLFKSPRSWDATCRLRGWQTLADSVQQVREKLRSKGQEAVIAGNGWNLPGVLSFYLPDHPTVYSLGLITGGRHSQYDFWRPNPINDVMEFRGRTFIYIGELHPAVRSGFDTVETLASTTHYVQGRPIASWQVSICQGFNGFVVPAAAGH